jgi:hypothetical protein
METRESVELEIAAYRQAGRELAREQGLITAGVVHAGTLATAGRRRELGLVTASVAEAILEACCGDVLITAAAQELDAFTAAWVERWFSQNWECVGERVARLRADPPPADTAEESAYRTVAAAAALGVASDHRVARSLLAGAAAVARLRRHGRSDVTGSTEDQIVVMAQSDPAVAAAWDELNDDGRHGPGSWVIHCWNDICSAAEELAALTAAATAPITVEQRVAIARHEVVHGMLRGVRDPSSLGAEHERARVAVIAYTEAAAEALARWEAGGGSPEDAAEAMQLHAEADMAAAGAQALVTPDARARLRDTVIERWAQLAPPLS